VISSNGKGRVTKPEGELGGFRGKPDFAARSWTRFRSVWTFKLDSEGNISVKTSFFFSSSTRETAERTQTK
jgi:hypothetical protein